MRFSQKALGSYGAENQWKRAQLQLARDSKESRVESVNELAVSTTSSATTPTMPMRMADEVSSITMFYIFPMYDSDICVYLCFLRTWLAFVAYISQEKRWCCYSSCVDIQAHPQGATALQAVPATPEPAEVETELWLTTIFM